MEAARQFLHEWRLTKGLTSDETWVQRYRRFSNVRFGDKVSVVDKQQYLEELLPFEHAFAEGQDSIGCVSAFPFGVEVQD